MQVFNDQLTPNQITASLGDDGFEDFERDVFPAWTATSLWHIEDNTTSRWPTYDLPSNSHFAWYGDNRTNDYNTSDRNSGTFTSDSINLTLIDGNIELRFWSWAQTENEEGVDEMKVYISPNGGSSWDHLGNITDSATWQAWVFDITDYRGFDNVLIRFFFNTVDEAYNNYPGWKIDDISIGRPVERFNLRIEQDYYAGVHDVRVMEFYADSYFDHGMDVDISIDIETPSGTVENLFYKEGTWIDAYGSWVYDIEYEFTEVGHYNVYFRLVDDAGTGWQADCWWEIEGDFFGVWIFQDNYAKIYEVRGMEFSAESFFDYGMYVSIGLDIETPSGAFENLYFEENIWIEAYESWSQSIEYEFTEVGHYNVYFRVGNETGGYWSTDCWWDIEGDFFDLWIEQDNYADLNEVRGMNFHAESYFDYGMYVSIGLDIETPSGAVEPLFFEENLWIEAYESWFQSIEYEFTEVGHYNVYFRVANETGGYWLTDCWWEITEKPQDTYLLYIYQESIAGITDIRAIDFVLESFFDSPTEVIIEITITTPSGVLDTLFLEEWVWIDSYGRWDHHLDYEFREAGEYMVIFAVIDAAGNELATDCRWIIEEDFIGLWIEQDNYAGITDRRWMNFQAKNYFNSDIQANIEIDIETPSGTIIDVLYEEWTFIGMYETWKYDYEYEFRETGEYNVYFKLTSPAGEVWDVECWWNIEENFFGLWIEQDTFAHVNERRWMYFDIKNYFDYTREIDIMISIDTPSGTTDEVYDEQDELIDAYGTWYLDLEYEFSEIGFYKVHFIVIDESGAEWYADCEWRVKEKEDFTLKIDQDTRAEVGDEKRMNFYAESHFGHGMDVNISIYIVTPSGDQELLYSEDFIYIDDYGSWALSIPYKFTEAGEYTVHFILIDDIGAKWFEECPWKIEDAGIETTTTSEQVETTGEQQSETPSITPGFESLIIILAIAAVVLFSKKR